VSAVRKLEGLQGAQQGPRGETRLESDDCIHEVGLVDRAHGDRPVKRRPAAQGAVGQFAQVVHRLSDLSLGTGQIAPEPDIGDDHCLAEMFIHRIDPPLWNPLRILGRSECAGVSNGRVAGWSVTRMIIAGASPPNTLDVPSSTDGGSNALVQSGQHNGASSHWVRSSRI
jgi:hypothetical protein